MSRRVSRFGVWILAAIAISAAGRADPSPTLWPADLAVDTNPYNQAHGQLRTPGLAVIADGSGGAIAVWEDYYLGLLAAQRIAADGSLLWGPQGVFVASANGPQWSPVAISDGAGGVIVTWIDGRNGTCGYGFFAECDVFAQRLAPSGEPLWAQQGVPIAVAPKNQGTRDLEMVADGTGGAIVVWSDYRDFTEGNYAQRIDGSGQVHWAANGVRIVVGYPLGLSVVPDASHGALFSFTLVNDDGDDVLYVQRVTSAGQLAWAAPGVACEINIGFFSMTGDGAGGAILAYVDAVPAGQFMNLIAVAQRVDATGALLWPGGRLLADSEKPVMDGPWLVGDGSGGAIATWQQGRRNAPPEQPQLNADVYAQRIAADGTIHWGAAGLAVSQGPADEMAPTITADGSGGAIVAWSDCRNHPQIGCQVSEQDLYAQRISHAGALAWPGGIAVSTAPGVQGMSYGAGEGPSSAVVSMDGAGGAFLAWPDGRNQDGCRYASFPSNCDLYVQRLPEPASDVLIAAGIAMLLALGGDQIRRARPCQYGSRSSRT